MARGLLSNDFATVMDKTIEDSRADFKSYSELTQNQGQIRLEPNVKRNIQAFIQWTRDEIRMGKDPTLSPFPVSDTPRLIK